MPKAVIVDAVRTPIGRAFKGSLAQVRPDETGAFIVDQLLERNPGVDPALVEEVITGCGMPQGKQAFNVGRIIALLSQKLPQEVNGSTISRYCASGLEAIRIASNNVRAGQGDVYIASGIEFVSQFNERTEAAGAADQNEHLKGQGEGEPDVYIQMGDTAVNVAKRYDVKREDMDAYARSARRSWPCSPRRVDSSTARSPPSRCPRHRGGRGRRSSRLLHPGEAGLAPRGLRGGRRRDRRQLVPA